MSILPAQTLLKEDPRLAAAPDFAELRRRGLEHVARLSGDLWTDHNLHDPGVTLLEVLCYALTDLGYRTSLDAAELFAPASANGPDDNFYTPAQILTNNPVTLLDYRKMLVDIPGVRNAWLEPADAQEVPLHYRPATEADCHPRELATVLAAEYTAALHLNGLYRVLLDLEPTVVGPGCAEPTVSRDATLREVNQRLAAHRNLGEDYLEVEVLGDEEIALCLGLDLDPKADPAMVLGEVLQAIEDFIAPRVRFASLAELLAEGKPIDEIYRGRPYLPDYRERYGRAAASHGFVDTEQLAALQRPTVIRASDLYQVIMDVAGVRAIRELKLASYVGGVVQQLDEEWELPLSPGHRPLFAPERGGFQFYKGQLRVPLDTTEVITRFRRRLADYRKTVRTDAELDLAVPYGQHRDDLGNYYSVQHELPLTYRIGEGELPDTASAERRAQVAQLRGFLTFFDQLLADYCVQLSRGRELLSWGEGVTGTNFSQPELGTPGGEDILRFLTAMADKEQPIVRGARCYDHPLDRDQAIASLTNDFRELSLTEWQNRLRTEEKPAGWCFLFADARGDALLSGLEHYRDEESARTAGLAAALK
ncbi:MAG: hypothetical protein AAFN92_02205, partial [Bacteroidota bacterium]